MSNAVPQPAAAPMSGLRVLDLSQAVSGPYVGRILSDLGADVVKVEWARGDIANNFGEMRGGMSGLFTQMNAGKRGIGVDIDAPSAKSLLTSLGSVADVVIENFRPGVLDRAGIGYHNLALANSRLVMLSISGFGRSGPGAGRMAYAPVIHAESGLLRRQAELDERADIADIALSLADTLAGLHGVVAVLAALNLRGSSGAGQHIDLSILEAMVASDDYAHYAVDGASSTPTQRGEIWETSHGPLMIAADARLVWAKLRDGIGHSDLGVEAGMNRAERISRRRDLISKWLYSFASRTDLAAALDQARLAWADVQTTSDLFASPTIANSDVVVAVADGAGGSRGVVRMPYRFSNAACEVRRGAPRAGEHTREILADWLGLDSQAIDQLAVDGTLIERRAT